MKNTMYEHGRRLQFERNQKTFNPTPIKSSVELPEGSVADDMLLIQCTKVGQKRRKWEKWKQLELFGIAQGDTTEST